MLEVVFNGNGDDFNNYDRYFTWDSIDGNFSFI